MLHSVFSFSLGPWGHQGVPYISILAITTFASTLTPPKWSGKQWSKEPIVRTSKGPRALATAETELSQAPSPETELPKEAEKNGRSTCLRARLPKAENSSAY